MCWENTLCSPFTFLSSLQLSHYLIVKFVSGFQSLIHLLRSEGVSLNDEPIPPVDKSKHPKGYIPIDEISSVLIQIRFHIDQISCISIHCFIAFLPSYLTNHVFILGSFRWFYFLISFSSRREWIKDLSDSITRGFLRASELGVQLNEPWIVCSSATYLWNYNNHLLSSGRHRELIGSFNSLLQDLKQVGHAGWVPSHL